MSRQQTAAPAQARTRLPAQAKESSAPLELLQEFEDARSRPSVLFTASHGMVWPSGDPHQRAAQGALLCQDFPGFGSVLPSHFVTGGDVTDNAHVHGLVAFHFAC